MRLSTRGAAACGLALLLAACTEGALPDAPSGPEPVDHVDLTPGSATIAIGQETTLEAVPRGASGAALEAPVAWSTSDDGVATISAAGVVRGVAEGTATITATSGGKSADADITVSADPPPPTGDVVVLVGAGDIARCDLQHDEATAALLDDIEGTVFTLGDNVYADGTAQEFADCYDPSWGRHRARTRPVAGNHDYETSGAAGYFGYFGAAAGDPAKGYYSYEAGDWHVVVLNSNISRSASSPQIAWLQADLAASSTACTVAMWHHPRFSSGDHGNDASVAEFWNVLHAAGAELVLVGHDHNYERFAPQTPAAAADPARGIRQFVVGTGGTSLRGVGSPEPNSEFRDDEEHGVLKLELWNGGYRWTFITTPNGDVLDSGEGACH